MRHHELNFQSFYQTRLQDKLAQLDRKKLPALFATGYMRFATVVFYVVFFSIFLGFIMNFTKEMPYVWVITVFMMFVAFLVLYGNIRKYVLQDLKIFFPKTAEDRRLVNVITIGSIIIMMVGAGYLGAYYLGDFDGIGFFARYGGAIIGMVVLMIPVIFFQKVAAGFALHYKKVLMPELIKYSGIQAFYDGDEYISQAEFLESGFYQPEKVSKYVGYDLVKGKEGETDFRFSQLEVQEYRSKGSKSEIVEIFKGLYYVSDFNKNMEGHTLVVPDVATELLGRNLGERMNKIGAMVYKDVKLEQMENSEFEDYFSVFSSDPIEARYILSPKLAEQIMNLRKQLGRDYSLSFKNGKMFISIESGKDLLGPNLFASLDNKERAEEINDFLNLILGITQKFDLNTRIWSK